MNSAVAAKMTASIQFFKRMFSFPPKFHLPLDAI
jgi:hypothetical protein